MAELKFGPTYVPTWTPPAQKKTADRLVPRRRVLVLVSESALVVEPVYTTAAATMLSHGAHRNDGGGAGARHRWLSIGTATTPVKCHFEML
jgi:hypothetical protein